MESGDMIGSTRCFAHKAWDLHITADWTEVLHRAVQLVGSDVENDSAIDWNYDWEVAAR